MNRRALSRLFSLLVIASLLLTPMTSAVQAQDSGPVYLPLVASGQASAPSSDLLYRAHITVSGAARWQRLEQLGVVILEWDALSATVLVDFLQLEQLAKLQFQPGAWTS